MLKAKCPHCLKEHTVIIELPIGMGLQQQVDSLSIRYADLAAERDALCKALQSVKYICEQRAMPPSATFKLLIEIASNALAEAHDVQ